MIYPIRMIRKTPNFLPAIAGIALMTITACASAALGDFTKATQDAAIAAAVAEAEADAASAAQTAADTARTAQNTAVATARAEEKRIAQRAQGIAVAAARCTDPICDNIVKADDLPDYPTAPPSSADAFLTITGTEITTTGVTVAGGVIGGATRAGDNMDGYRYFQGQFGGAGNTLNFAGILPTTDLGAPLTAQPTTADWPGTYTQARTENNDITFNIDFINRRITATTDGDFSALSFNLGFSDSGVISGAVSEFDIDTESGRRLIAGSRVATGLIGTEGLVGVFINASPSRGGLRQLGGFVANNPVYDNVVNADDLPSYPTAAPSAASTFLTITGAEIATTGITRAGATLTIQKATRADICEVRGGGETTCAPTKNTNTMNDGFQYFQGEFGGTDDTLNFAGILPTTNLGAPLTAQPTTAAWPGFYTERTLASVPLLFNIDFANRRITATTVATVSALSFNLGFSDSGVISGAVSEHDLGTGTRILASRTATGLIGTEGLVGVFINASDIQAGARFVGGFVANNPDTN